MGLKSGMPDCKDHLNLVQSTTFRCKRLGTADYAPRLLGARGERFFSKTYFCSKKTIFFEKKIFF